MAGGADLNLKTITTPIAATGRTIIVPNEAALPNPLTLLPLRAIAMDTGQMYVIETLSWSASSYEE